MENIKISVIIPCYNASKYLKRIFKALDNQTYRNFEVIFINDGSNDNTLSLLEGYSGGKDYVYVYSFVNAGVSESRNRGLERATGDYIWFSDADDYFTKDLFEDVVRLINTYDFPDDVSIRYQWVMSDFDESKHVCQSIEENITVYKGKEIFDAITNNIIGFSDSDLYRYYKTKKWEWNDDRNSVYSHFYRRSIIEYNNLRFTKGLRIAEDRMFNCKALAFVNEIVCSNRIYYYYISTDNGALRKKVDARLLYNDKLQIVQQRELLRQFYLNKFGIDISYSYLGSNVISCFQLAVNLCNSGLTEGLRLYNEYVNNPLVSQCIDKIKTDDAPLKIKIPLWLLKHDMSKCFYLLVWLANKFGVHFHSL